jgi:acetyltransferase-like isoleucine patch superfamily enzyme
MSAARLSEAIEQVVKYPHKHLQRGELILAPEIFNGDDRDSNLVISPFCTLDCTGSIRIGPWCNIGHRSRVYTHDTIHWGRQPLALVEERCGVLWQDKYIGSDVWIHDGAFVLYQAYYLPDGFVLGAGSVLTKNPGPYEIWAGVPARKIGERSPLDPEEISVRSRRKRFLLKEYLSKKRERGDVL